MNWGQASWRTSNTWTVWCIDARGLPKKHRSNLLELQEQCSWAESNQEWSFERLNLDKRIELLYIKTHDAMTDNCKPSTVLLTTQCAQMSEGGYFEFLFFRRFLRRSASDTKVGVTCTLKRTRPSGAVHIASRLDSSSNKNKLNYFSPQTSMSKMSLKWTFWWLPSYTVPIHNRKYSGR